jgi:inhibitor of cysteine peptidase
MENRMTSKIFIFSLFLLVMIVAAACQPIVADFGKEPKMEKEDKKTDAKIISEAETSQELKKFNSANEIKEFLKNAQQNQDYQYFGGYNREIVSLGMGVAQSSIGITESSAPRASQTASKAADFSSTNVQVQGVDEADIVKNDGKYIYTLTNDKLVIVDAFPAIDAEISSVTKIDGTPRNMLVNGDRLVIFTDDNDELYVIAQYDIIPRVRYTPLTHVLVYDISDRNDPKLVKDYNINGNYLESRMIDDYVYFISQENVYYYNNIIDLPVIRESLTTIASPEIFYFDNPESNYNFNTVASFNIFDDKDSISAKSFMMGYSNTIYVSKNSIYIAYQKNFPYYYYQRNNEERFFKIVVPLLPSEKRTKIESIGQDDSLDSSEKWGKISDILEDMYNNMERREQDKLIGEIMAAIEEYEARLEAERRKSIIHKINIDEGDIDYDSKGEVPGYLLNQFSLDEHDGNLRVATTTQIWARESVLYNNVFVLDDDMGTIGKIEAIAPDERIYSTRFIGDRLYMVTFKRIDPFFVIGLSDPKNPEILGELKIPGFSDYLHPYDEDYIIGIGKETESNQWGGVSTKGVKLALFDVSDVSNPKQVDKYEIGESGTDSEALKDHKAFLFDKEKDLLVIPVREVKGKRYYDNRYRHYRQRIWQGAYVFSLNPEHGFKVKGKISHYEDEQEDGYYYYTSPNAVRRSLYMDDTLYTVSQVKIKANNLGNVDEEITEVNLPYEDDRKYPKPYPVESEPIRILN